MTAPPYSPLVERPSVAKAGWAFGLSLAGCCVIGNIVSTVLALQVVKKSRETGVDHGNGFAVAALAINAACFGFIALLAYLMLGIGLAFTDEAHEVGDLVNADPRVVGDVDTLKAGDCLLVPSLKGERGGHNLRVPCDELHDAEVTFRFRMSAERFPGDRAVERQARNCAKEAFTAYVGSGPDAARLEVHYFAPDLDNWNDGQRAIVCLVSDPKGPVHERLGGSARG